MYDVKQMCPQTAIFTSKRADSLVAMVLPPTAKPGNTSTQNGVLNEIAKRINKHGCIRPVL